MGGVWKNLTAVCELIIGKQQGQNWLHRLYFWLPCSADIIFFPANLSVVILNQDFWGLRIRGAVYSKAGGFFLTQKSSDNPHCNLARNVADGLGF